MHGTLPTSFGWLAATPGLWGWPLTTPGFIKGGPRYLLTFSIFFFFLKNNFQVFNF
jgi:hypothetical protein